MLKTGNKKQLVLLGMSTLFIVATLALAACSAPASSSSSSAASSSAMSAAASALVVDEAAKTVSFPAVATGYTGESSIHFLVNENGSNADKAHFLTTVTSRELYDALESIGATHGDNIAIDDTEGTIEGSDLDLSIEFDNKTYSPSELVEGEQGRASKPRFGGNIDINEEYATGCLFCLESCSLGITSDSAYEYTEPETFAPTDNMPAAGTEVMVTYAL